MRISDDIPICWQPLNKNGKPAAGSFNTIYVSDEKHSILDSQNNQLYYGRLALKVPHRKVIPSSAALSQPERAVRIFREIHPRIPALEHRPSLGGREIHGWVLPYYENSVKTSDEECATEVLRVYRETARIGIDFASRGNVLKVTESNCTYFVCVDVDAALLLEPDPVTQHRPRRGSKASCDYYKDAQSPMFLSYLPAMEAAHPSTIKFIRTLLCLHRAGPTSEQRQELTFEVMESLSYVYEQQTDFYDQNPGVLLNLAFHLKEKIALRKCINQSPPPLLAKEAEAVLDAVDNVAPDNLQDLPKLTAILKETRVVLENPTLDACERYNDLAQNAQLSKKWGRLVGGAMLIFAGALLCTFGGLLICGGVGLTPFTFGVSAAAGIVAGSAAIVGGLAVIRWGCKILLSGQETRPKKAMHQFFTAANEIATMQKTESAPSSPDLTVQL